MLILSDVDDSVTLPAPVRLTLVPDAASMANVAPAVICRLMAPTLTIDEPTAGGIDRRAAGNGDCTAIRDAAVKLAQGCYDDSVSADRNLAAVGDAAGECRDIVDVDTRCTCDRAAVGDAAGKGRRILYYDTAVGGNRAVAGDLDTAGNDAGAVDENPLLVRADR